ncbi:MAG: FHA domain-containing protein [Thiogranum sp.]|nr:FHA domain-containing protein [Thiogranum sp.]
MAPPVSTWIISAADASIGDRVVAPGEVLTVGRHADCDIVIAERYVSRRHAEVLVRDNRLFVRDLQSTYGTLVNGRPVTECELQPGDEIRIDRVVFVVRQPPAVPAGDNGTYSEGAGEAAGAQPAQPMRVERAVLVGISPAFLARKFELQAGKMLVGSGPDADIRLEDASVSAVHARITSERGRWKVVDILSANGTFVNGKKIQGAWLRPGDVVRFGSVNLQFADSE